MSDETKRCCAPEGWHIGQLYRRDRGAFYTIWVNPSGVSLHCWSDAEGAVPLEREHATLESALAAVDAHVAERAAEREGVGS